MATQETFLRDVLHRALAELEARRFALYTLAYYHDHESGAVALCADTRESSARVVARINRYNAPHFLAAIEAGNLKRAALWQANVGRSLSLGDFAAVNLARTALPRTFTADLYLAMIRTMVADHERIRALADDPDSLALAASGPDDEVALVWTPAAR